MKVEPTYSESSSLKRRIFFAVLCCFVFGLAACDSQLEIDNAAPRITWVAVHPPLDGESIAEVTVWISDMEGDPVNLAIDVIREDGSTEELLLEPGGHGLVGLTTQESRFDPNGQPHLLLWDTAGLEGAMLQLGFSPDDNEGGTGDTVVTPMFEVDVGLYEAVPVELVP
jgi:hypothetical protein